MTLPIPTRKFISEAIQTAQSAFIGKNGDLTLNPVNGKLVYHDGITAGGKPIPLTVVGGLVDATPIGSITPSTVKATTGNFSGLLTVGSGILVGVAGNPTITSGAGVPVTVQPNGSLYLRSDGTTGARFYISNGTIWAAVTGV